MINQERKKLVNELVARIRKVKDGDITLTKSKINNGHNVDEKYVSKKDYKELVALFEILKNDNYFVAHTYEKMIDENHKKFPFLFKCNHSIYDFVTELKCGGPYYIAKEMCRQGKEIDYINKHIGKSNIIS